MKKKTTALLLTAMMISSTISMVGCNTTIKKEAESSTQTQQSAVSEVAKGAVDTVKSVANEAVENTDNMKKEENLKQDSSEATSTTEAISEGVSDATVAEVKDNVVGEPAEINPDELVALCVRETGAGLEEAKDVKIEPHIGNKEQVYDVSFTVKDKEYNFVVDGTTGKVEKQ